MPYLEHFSLQAYPFRLTPDSQLYYPLPQTEAILQALFFSIERGDGLMKVTGEIGSGKTMLCRLLLNKLQEKDNVQLAYINAPVAFDPAQVPEILLREFSLKQGRKNALVVLQDFLIKGHGAGKKTVLVIDEAQALGPEGLEVIRLLSNLETETDKLLQIVLFAQPELDRILDRADMRQFRQRICFSFATQGLTKDETSAYVAFRLSACQAQRKKTPVKGKKTAGQKKKTQTPKEILMASQTVEKGGTLPLWTAAALTALFRISRGVPRLVNLLADKALMAAYSDGVHKIEARHVRMALREMEGFSFWQRFWLVVRG